MIWRYWLRAVVAFIVLCVGASASHAQWAKNGTPVCNEINTQMAPRTISDGENGAILIWVDNRYGADWDIYGNRVDSNGHVLGGSVGVPVSAFSGQQMEPRLIPDGTGGAIVAWLDSRDGPYHIYAQRVDGTGTARWAENGIPICTAANNQTDVRIAADGAGGAIIIWADGRDGGQYDLYAQRVNADGDTLWKADGALIAGYSGDQTTPEMIPDGAGGAIIVWCDMRNGDADLYAQRIDGGGALLWGADGVPICLATGTPTRIGLVASSGGGACVAWTDYRSGTGDAYVQKIDGSGVVAWQSDGLPICAQPWNKYSSQIADDGSGGAIVAWYDERSYYEVYAQRIDADGTRAWAQDGVRVFPSYGDGDPSIMADGFGGAIVVLDMYPDEELPNDIYAQRLDHDGNPLWGPDGFAVCAAPDGQFSPSLAPDGRGGAIISWQDNREYGALSDIYCQRVGASGLWGSPEPAILSCADVPGDQGGWLRVTTRASSLDVAGEYDSPIAGYNVWRMISGGGGPLMAPADAAEASVARSALLARIADPARATGVRVGAAEAAALGLPEGEWESVGFWFATRDTLYNIAVPTKEDSTEAGTPLETFIVTAHASAAGVFVASEPAEGYSVDNLAPGSPTGFEGNETDSPPGLLLSWNASGAPDLKRYDVHRGNDELFEPDESNRLDTTDGTTLLDAGWLEELQYYYKLVAVDRHGNASSAALLRPEDIKVGALLQGFAARIAGSFVEISWTLSEVGKNARFSVFRAKMPDGDFGEISAPAIERSGLSFSMRDGSCEPGTTYRYRVDYLDETGSRTLFETESVTTPAMPLSLHQNHPNPFNPSTVIGYYLPAAAEVTLEVYDPAGRLVSRILDRAREDKGTHAVEWRGIDSKGQAAGSGVYFYRLTCGKETISRKMVLMR